jgi:F-type H+-transporting ATPase subunit epsilon
MNALLTVTIAHVDGPIFTGEVRSLMVPGSEGYLTVLYGHEPLITSLKKGEVRLVTKEGTEERYVLEGGVLEVSGTSAIIIV